MDDIQNVKLLLQRYGVDGTNGGEEDEFKGSGKLSEILKNAEEEQAPLVKTINDFIADEVQKRKLCNYCENFSDPTIKSESVRADDGEVELHAYLSDDELCRLYKFVKRHTDDGSFGDTVYNVMTKHGMVAPQVYKNASLRRQDFARATDSRCKSVTRQLAWQIIVGLHCTMDEADEVLFSAGYIRRETSFDLTMQYFIERKNYDVMAINEVLYALGLKPFSVDRTVKNDDPM